MTLYNFKYKIVNQKHKRILFSYFKQERQIQIEEIFTLQEAKQAIKILKKAIEEYEDQIRPKSESFFDYQQRTGGIK